MRYWPSESVEFPIVGFGIPPFIGRFNSSLDARIRLEQIKQVCTLDQLDGFVLCELERRGSIPTRRNQYPLRCTLVLQRAEQVSHRRYTNRVLVPLGLYDDLPAENRPRVVSDAINTAIARRANRSTPTGVD